MAKNQVIADNSFEYPDEQDVDGKTFETKSGSVLRPSGCHDPLNGVPAKGTVTDWYKWMSPFAAAASNHTSIPASA